VAEAPPTVVSIEVRGNDGLGGYASRFFISAKSRIRRSCIGLGGQSLPLIRKIAGYHHIAQEPDGLVASREPYRLATRVGRLGGDTVIALDGVATPAVDALHKLLTDDRIGERVIITFLPGVELCRRAVIPLETQPRA